MSRLKTKPSATPGGLLTVGLDIGYEIGRASCRERVS